MKLLKSSVLIVAIVPAIAFERDGSDLSCDVYQNIKILGHPAS